MKKILLLVILQSSFFSLLKAGGAPNDSCANAIPLTCDTSVSGSTTLASIDTGLPTCGMQAATAKGVWYSFIGTGEYITVSTCDSATYDSRITIFSGTCGSMVCVAENDDGVNCTGLSSRAGFNSSNGIEYFFLIHGFDADAGDFTLTVSCDSPCTNVPLNDSCLQAITLNVYADTLTCQPDTGTNFCATATFSNECDFYGFVQDVWYKFNTGSYQGVYVLLDEITGTGYACSLYDTSCNSTPMFCLYPTPGIAALAFGLQPNTDYWMQVWNGGFENAGSFTLCVAGFTPPPPPVNDPCANADTLTVNPTCIPTAGTCVSATQDYPPDSCGGFMSANAYDVWYAFVATQANIDVQVDPTFDPVVQVMESCGGKIVGCSDVAGMGQELINLTGLTIGNTYFIRVYPWNGNPGPAPISDAEFDICLITGLADIFAGTNLEKIRIYPNPSSGNFNIQGMQLGMNWNLFDISGRMLLEGNSTSVDAGFLSGGIYFLKVIDEESSRVLRVVLD